MLVQTLKGFRDLLPSEKRKRDFVLKKIIEIFERFGFEPLETPTLEYADLLLGKYGEEADKLVYTFEDKGGRKVGLRYDQTVPTARVLAQYANELPKYFRRYQIQSVFRADKPQKGRFREFTQCDIDIFGSISPIADAEILACTYFAYKNVGYPKIVLKINDRQTLFKTLEKFATEQVSIFSIIQSVDKLDKQAPDEVIEELTQKGIDKSSAKEVLQAIKDAQMSDNLGEIIKKAEALGIPAKSIEFSPSLARGLDYYTGMIFEVIIDGYYVGSAGGGGRYDRLIEQLGGNNVPAVGIAFGFDRMVEAATELNLFPKTIYESAQVFVTIFDKSLEEDSLNLCNKLREKKISTEVWVESGSKMEKQLKYADQIAAAYVAIIGPEEKKKNIITIKNLAKREQAQVSLDEFLKILQK